ncbi:helix-turn-helix domain-containing protein [Sphingobacterium spiritivorum]|uniref:helix-turn-helix domain-containing protein n=1 Tax=Sphingobacterium spiritivorum TaxID=258 RepID=UPI003DA693AE
MNKNKKHSFDFKLSCVQQLEAHYLSADSLSRELGISKSLLKKWSMVYRHQGPAGLLPRVGKREFSPSFKLEVLSVIQKENLSLSEACIRFDLSSDQMILSWQTRLQKYGLQGLEPRPKGKRVMNDKLPIKRKKRKSKEPLSREEELLQELEYLRAENALLKKLHALAHAENKRKP